MDQAKGVHGYSKIDEPLYNSRNIKNYIEYTKNRYPEIDIESILLYAGITTYELEDQGHWFTQRQVDKFYEILSQETGDPNISREVGRYAATSKASGAVKQYALGFMTPAAAYWVVKNFASRLTRGHTFKTKKLGPNKIEVVVAPHSGVLDKPYQCNVRIGLLEALSKLFTKKFAKIEHPTCIHRGGDICRYIITWERTSSSLWRWIRNYLVGFSFFVCLALYFFIPLIPWLAIALLCVSIILGISFFSEHLEKEDLIKNLETQGDAARDLLDEINLRYNDALLVKEIGQATSMLLDIQKLLKTVVEAMEKRLDFDRGGIWLATKEKTHLVYIVGYGYNQKVRELLQNTKFHLDKPHSKGIAIQAFRQQRPFLVNEIAEIEKDFSRRSLEFIKRTGAKSFICVPVIYEGESLGVLFVDNLKSKRILSQSDMSILMGIAPQIAISIHNAMSYQELQERKEREKRLRKLFEKYVPAPIIKQYIDSQEADLFKGEEISITAMFLDIRGFTSSSESMDAKEAVSFLNDYFERCSFVIGEENGHINKYTGDGFLAIFGAPEPLRDHITMAFNAAGRILEMSEEFILEGRSMGIGIGLHTGKAILGNIGSQNKIEYTAIGDTVNTAARLQELTKSFNEFPIIMSRDAWKELAGHPSHAAITNLGMQQIRGKKEKQEAFGFKPLRDYSLPLYQREGDFVPFRKTKEL